MAYNISKLQDRYAVMNGEKKAGGFVKKGPPFQQWKPALTEDGKPKTYNLRFLPYQDQNEQPFQEVNYYDNKALSQFRLVAPAQFNLEDPIAELVTEMRKDRSNKGAWNVIKGLLPRPRYFAPVLVREEADKGVQIWELSPTVCKEIYAILVSEDYRDEDVTNPEKGYDFQVSVSPSGKMFKQPGTGKEFPVNDVKILARTKPSKLLAKPELSEALIKSIPNLQEIFAKQVQTPEQLRVCLDSYLAQDASTEAPAASTTGVASGPTDKATEDAAMKSIADQFADL